ncbi:MAG: TIGR03862 family flavoprotein, partial [Pseudomonadota bacterium]|nr:TIGR03862 family flavoprotein [Pseudomonadota bacterium]
DRYTHGSHRLDGHSRVAAWLEAFGPAEVRAWAKGLGIQAFVGSNGRVFPTDMKAAPLLRAWLHRLRGSGVRFHTRHRWVGWVDGQPSALRFIARGGAVEVDARVCILALGGASWPRLGSDGAWVPLLEDKGVDVAALRASNCGFDVARQRFGEGRTAGPALPGSADATPAAPFRSGWSDHFRSRHAGQPLKTVALRFGDAQQPVFQRSGEFIVTEGGIEGSLVYAASSAISDAIAARGRAVVHLDLLPGRSLEFIRAELARPRGSRSLSTHLKSRFGIDGVKAGLLHELLPRETFAVAAELARSIKSLPLTVVAARPIAEAISSAGGVRFDGLTDGSMLKRVPGVFCCGEMLDWDAPTGGYLLTGCFASGVAAANGVLRWLSSLPNSNDVFVDPATGRTE